LNRLVQVSRTNGDVEDYAYNTLGALSENAGVVLNMQWPRLDGNGTNDSAIPSSFNGLPVTRDGGGRITSLNGASLVFGKRNEIQTITDGTTTETYGYDGFMRRIVRSNNQGVEEAYVYEDTTLAFGGHSIGPTASSLVAGNYRPPFDRTPQTLGAIDGLAPQNIVAILDTSGGVTSAIFYDGVDSPLRLSRSGLIYYYEVDIAGNVRRIRDLSGNDLGGYRYTAFGELYAADADTPAPSITQPLQWKGRWFNPLASGIYDVRARQWSPGMGAFLQIDEFEYHGRNSTLWGWAGQSPVRRRDPRGRIDQTCIDSIEARCEQDCQNVGASCGLSFLAPACVAECVAVEELAEWAEPGSVCPSNDNGLCHNTGNYIKVFPGGSWRICQYDCGSNPPKQIVQFGMESCAPTVPG
jgi:RHS repeat-associated protein